MPIREAYDRLMNEELFRIATVELYSPNIPQYYRTPAKSQLPVLNGNRVSWEEYLEARPDAEKPEEFIPDMVYTPAEQNIAESRAPIATIIDMLENDVDFYIGDPDTTYPRILEILKGYVELAELTRNSSPAMQSYLPKVERAIQVLGRNYDLRMSRKRAKLGMDPDGDLSGFEKIEKLFG